MVTIPEHEETAERLAAIENAVERFQEAAQITDKARIRKGNARTDRAVAAWVLHNSHRRAWPMAKIYTRYELLRRYLSVDFDRIPNTLPRWVDEGRFDATSRLCDLWLASEAIIRATPDVATKTGVTKDKAVEKTRDAITAIQDVFDGLATKLLRQEVHPETVSALMTKVAELLEVCEALHEQMAEPTLTEARRYARPVAALAQEIHAQLFPPLEKRALPRADRAHQEWLTARAIEATALRVRDQLWKELMRGQHGGKKYTNAELANMSGRSSARASQLATGRTNQWRARRRGEAA